MVRIDENHEAIARISMAVNSYDALQAAENQQENDNDGDTAPQPVVEGAHWKLGSPWGHIISAQEWETSEAGPAFHRFENKLTAFLGEVLPRDEQPLQPLLVCSLMVFNLYLRFNNIFS